MKKLNFFSAIFVLFFLSACFKGKNADLVIYNAQIHVMDDGNTIYEAMAIKDGKILEVGPERQILNKYTSDEEINAEGKSIYPGFTDAHGHIIGLAIQKLSANLVGAKSWAEVIVRLQKHHSRSGKDHIVGRGWDQSLWSNKEMPDNDTLNKLFSNTPVFLERIDGHAALVNEAMLKKAGITPTSEIKGGLVEIKDGKCTGILLDNAIELVRPHIPQIPVEEMRTAILEIQDELFSYGITGVHEAGISFEQIRLFEKLIEEDKFHLNLYAMLMPSQENRDFAEKNGIYIRKNLKISSFKVYADGALGSRGALLKKPYADMHGHSGLLLTEISEMNELAEFCGSIGYQMNTHAIGDSANHLLLNLYKSVYEKNPDHRWRIEHAQIVDPIDFDLFGKYGVFPSVQPTHATSDQRWAEARLGKNRLNGAYAYQTLKQQYGMIAFGTDFPVEQIDPFLTIHAAVNRKTQDNQPAEGFLMKEKLDLFDCLRAMTIWPAFAAFQENELGSLEKGKDATFVIFDKPIVNSPNYQENYAYITFIKGRKVYSME